MITSDVFIHVWFSLAVIVTLLNLVGIQSKHINSFVIILLFICAGMTPTNYNPDITNYFTVYQSMKTYQPIAWNYEPGYNFIVFLFNKLTNGSEIGFFFVRIMPGLILAYAVYSNRFHTSFSPFYMCCIGLVLSSTTLRASYAFSVLSLALVMSTGRKPVISSLIYLSTIMMHMSSAPIVLMGLVRKINSKATYVGITIFIVFIILFGQTFVNLIDIAVMKIMDRGTNFRVGIPIRVLQLIIVMMILFIVFKKNGRFLKNNLGSITLLAVLSLILIAIVNYGLSRVLLYVYPLIFLKENKSLNLISLNRLVCLVSLPGAFYFYHESLTAQY